MNYTDYAKAIKAMGDASRLKIIDLLSCGSLCACDILEHFTFSQPTLSHHMKVLQNAGIVVAHKEGKWQHYTLRSEFITTFKQDTELLLAGDTNCICHTSTDDAYQKCTSRKGVIVNEKN